MLRTVRYIHTYILPALLLLTVCLAAPVKAETLQDFLPDLVPGELIEGGQSFGRTLEDPAAVEILGQGGDVVGHLILNTDYLPSIGYSGKPIFIVIAIDPDGVIHHTKMVKHSEPIVLAGIPIGVINDYIDEYHNNKIVDYVSGDVEMPDIIASATVTVIVIDDSIRRAATTFARAMGLAGLKEIVSANTGPRYAVDMDIDGTHAWADLVGDGSVRRMLLNVGEINDSFMASGHPKARKNEIGGDRDDVFIDLYAGLVSVPSIGRALLGDAEYALMKERLGENQHAVLIMANGQYSFRGSGFVRGGIFDRFQLQQGEATWLFRDKVYKRLGALGGEDAPYFSEIGLFLLPADTDFDPTEPWQLQLLINREVGALEKIFINRNLTYNLPSKWLKALEAPASGAGVNAGSAAQADAALWERIWAGQKLEVVIMITAIILLTVIFYSQMWLAARPVILKRVRVGFLLFTLIFIGGIAGAQISVVNIFTFTQSLMTGFSWDYFLRDPMIFILWFAVAAALIFWGRGAFCGWLCPFGALQELLNMIAKKLKIPQIEVPWVIHERLWPIKYILFLGLFGLSLYSLPLAEEMAEIEPFKTVILLKFAREWPFIIYALTLLSLGLFIERFYCRYVCPLGAALALPGRMRINDWLKRYRECGSPCQRCANECMVQAIHPEGHINPNECLNCMHCQELYNCKDRCPVVAKKWARREKIARMSRTAKETA